MRKALSIVAVMAALGASSALAADSMTGMVKSVDQAKHQITLKNGHMFNVNKDVNLASITPNEKVTITYTKSGKMMDASQVQRAP